MVKMVKTVVFISTPMHGLEEEQILENIREAEAKYLEITGKDASEVTFQNNLDGGKAALQFEREMADDHGCNFIEPARMRVWYLGIALCSLAYCDEVFFYPRGWWFSKGCGIEKAVCEAYEIEHYYENSPVPDMRSNGILKMMYGKKKKEGEAHGDTH